MNSTICPVCSETFFKTCKCPLGDRECERGHKWHTCIVHDTIVMGEADHMLPLNSCRCRIGDTESGNTIVKLPPKDVTPKFIGDKI